MSSIEVVGDVPSGGTDSGFPVKVGGVARQTNPTAVSNLQRVHAMYDDVGRQITAPFQVRDLVGTAVATLANNAADNETTLLDGVAGELHDLVYVSVANASTGAVRVVFRDGTSGADLFNVSTPANDTRELNFAVPWKQADPNMAWRVDFDTNANITNANDVTNTTVRVMALYVINV